MRLLVVGQKWLGAAVALDLVSAGHELLAVVVPRLDDRLARAALSCGADVIVAERRVQAGAVPPGCDLVVCAHAHCYVDAGVRSAARLGAVGYHPSLLPRHRGRDAVEWALRFQDPVAGGTVYQLDDGADTGPILAQDWCWVIPGDTAESLWRRELGPMGVRLLAQVVSQLQAGAARFIPQRDDVATFEPALTARRLVAG